MRRVSGALALLLALAGVPCAQAAPLESARGLVEQLRRAGRAEAALSAAPPAPATTNR